MTEENSEIIIYNTDDGKADVKLYSKDGVIWMNQQQMPRPKTPPQAGLTFLHRTGAPRVLLRLFPVQDVFNLLLVAFVQLAHSLCKGNKPDYGGRSQGCSGKNRSPVYAVARCVLCWLRYLSVLTQKIIRCSSKNVRYLLQGRNAGVPSVCTVSHPAANRNLAHAKPRGQFPLRHSLCL